MDSTLDSRFYSSAQLLHSTNGIGLLPRHPQDVLFHEAPPSFSHPNQSYP